MRNAGNTGAYFAPSLLVLLLESCTITSSPADMPAWSGNAMSDEVKTQLDCLTRDIYEDEEEDARRAAQSRAADELVELGRRNPDVIDRVIDCLQDDNRNARYWAASILLRIGPDAKNAVPRLVHLLEDKAENEGIRSIAGNALGYMGTDAIPVLGRLLSRSQDAFVRRKAADAFCRHHHNAKHAIPLLLKGTQDADREIRLVTVSSLVAFGQQAVPVLRDALRDEKTNAGLYIAATLVKLDIDSISEVVPILLDGIELSDAFDRAQAAWTCGEIAEKYRDLRRILDTVAIERIVKSLRLLLGDEDSRVRSSAASTLGSYGMFAQEAVPDLCQRLSDEDWLVRGWAVRSLGKIKCPSDQVVAALTAAISDDEGEVRGAAVDALGAMGAEAVDAVVALERALGRHADDHEMLRKIRLAMRKIRAGQGD